MTKRLSLMTFARMQAYGIVNLYSMCYNEAAINTNGIIAKYIFYKLEEMHMHKEINDKISVFKKVFLILLVLDIIGLISAVIALSPTFKQMAEYGQPMMAVFSVMFAIMVATQLFEILTKIFLIKSISPVFSWTSGRKGYIVSAKLLILFNFGAVVINLLAAGGEGATLLNQGNLYLHVLASVAEIITVFFYLRKVKKL